MRRACSRRVAFNVDFLLDLELVVDVFFYVDVFLQFFHGYVDLGFPVLDLRKVLS